MMRNTATLIAVLTLAWGTILTDAFGQKGIGDGTGIAQQTVKPDIVSLSGTVVAVKTEPCKMTTGRAQKGSHFALETSAGKKVDIHLGPEVQVDQIVNRLAVDQKTTVKAFRTESMAANAYVAQSLTLDGEESIRLRDDNLRPVWARGRWSAGDGLGPGNDAGCGAACGQGKGQGQACGVACGQGKGKGKGKGKGPGCGAACGQGNGKSPGCSAACGQGRGKGRGAGFSDS